MRSQSVGRAAFLILLLAVLSSPARAQDATTPTATTSSDAAEAVSVADDEQDADEYEVTARVLRVSLIAGEVSLRRNGNNSWESAKLNLPLVEGDTLTTAGDARLEIQIDARNFVRVGGDSVIHIVTLRDRGIALSLTEGTATVRLARFEPKREYFEVDAPQTTVAAEREGLYRVDVAREGRVRVTVRDGGRARVYSETSGFTLRENRTATFLPDDADGGDWELATAPSFDAWDGWTDERERFLASRLRYQDRDRYYDRDVWGAEELDAYGDWSYVSTYGWVWRPHVTVINNYHNWSPYRYGNWRWCPPYGWTWVGDEPWGWAPYHYGRWVYHNNNWHWAPRGYGYAYKRAWWRPALVAFVYVPTSFGQHVAWYPLGHGHRDPHSRRWQRHHDRLTPLRGRQLADLRRLNPAYLRAVTTLPTREFGAHNMRARPATTDIARRAVMSEPIRGRLPITPSDAGRSIEQTPTGRARLNIARPAPINPARDLPERRTGAALRTPGVSLDGELRRSRIFQGRAPRTLSPADSSERERLNNGRESLGVRGTGAVERDGVGGRPAAVRSPNERLRRGERDGGNISPTPDLSPDGPARARPRDGRSTDEGSPSGLRDRRRVEPSRPGNGEAPNAAERNDEGVGRPVPEVRRARPSRPNDEQPPSSTPRVYERPAPRERPQRPAPDERFEAPSRPRQEPPSRPREDRPPAPQPREQPQERPAPRQEAPPQRRAEPPPAERSRPEPREQRPSPARPARPIEAPQRETRDNRR